MAGLAHPVLSQKPRKQAWGVAVPSEARQEATDWMPDPTPLPDWRLASQSPSIWPQLGASVAAAVGLEKRESGAHPQPFPAWLTLEKQEEAGGPHAAGEVPCERHCRS